MDTTQTTHISLCTGYGGIDLGLRRCIRGLRTVAYAEIEASAIELLLARMEGGQLDPAPIWTDLRTFPWSAFSGRVDILSGGYPCQPFSAAGKRLGADDTRHLWPHIATGIQFLKPRFCFFENVEGHVTLGLRDVLRELGELGYRATWGLFSAAECGAPHQRKRVFVLAHRNGTRLERNITECAREKNGCEPVRSTTRCSGSGGERNVANSNNCGSWKDREPSKSRANGFEQSFSIAGRGDAGKVGEKQVWPSRPGKPQQAWEPPRVVGNAESGARLGRASGVERHSTQSNEGVGNADCGRQSFSLYAGGGAEADPRGQGDAVSAKPGQTQPALGRDADGPAGWLDYGQLCISCDNRTDELRMLGNGVVPATAERAFRVLISELTHNTTNP